MRGLKTSAHQSRFRKFLLATPVRAAVILLCFIWTIPSLGVLISSIRVPEEINRSGWWTVLSPRVKNHEYESLEANVTRANNFLERTQIQLDEAQAALNAGPSDEDVAAAVEEAEAGADEEAIRASLISDLEDAVTKASERVESAQEMAAASQRDFDESDVDKYFYWGSSGWRKQWTTDNYRAVLESNGMDTAFTNSLLITIPSVVIPITIAAFAAYAFAWLMFPGKDLFFAAVIISMGVPLHLALIPILKIYTAIDLGGTYLGVWLAHTGFGLPLAIYLIYGYMVTIPKEIMESAHIDGASPFTAFTRLILPLSVPVIASFAIFQFLWVWNDLLVSLVFLGAEEQNAVLTMQLAKLTGSKGQDWELLTAGAFITTLLPLLVFFSLQRYFVRGMMAGSVKG